MGSATGRHRRPRQAPAIVVAAGVTGSAIAIPLLGAGGAQAADATTWDRVAECESGGMWSADLGNGYYGGLQFSQETWSAYGGKDYAPRADLASRSQQIAVAEKVLDDKGPQAWPSCAVISGLALDGTLPGVDPGGEPSAEPSDTATASDTPSAEASDEADGAEKSDKSNGKSGAKTDKSDEADTSASAEASPSATPSSEASEVSGASKGDAAKGGKHRGTPAPEASASTGSEVGSGRESGRHASRGDSDARQGADGTYTVRAGDNLWAIADAQELPGGWPALYEANKSELGSDPDLILPGQNLVLDVAADAADARAEAAAGN
ncbi:MULTISPECIES: LysM peptidoglycan-binding domain-containing protein [unclassified Streptomyces]|uniref:LysM peptidoglycan-binding domain-containing protein n=1 Tax=unclassified Streptomyces TaxID=2593676 RepID=UPI00093C7995|nr:transglycosylase family protein [Streptomyces sp. CB02058]OKI87315.1 transglycosylase domain-containing protein [Streptomyces sp. CB02058]